MSTAPYVANPSQIPVKVACGSAQNCISGLSALKEKEMGSLSVTHWMIVLLVVILVFGTKKLGNIGSDLGKAVKGFKDGLQGEDGKPAQAGPLAREAKDQ